MPPLSTHLFSHWSIPLKCLLPCSQPVQSMKFLGDEETVRKAIESVMAQGKAK
jgi:hypothetical protein